MSLHHVLQRPGGMREVVLLVAAGPAPAPAGSPSGGGWGHAGDHCTRRGEYKQTLKHSITDYKKKDNIRQILLERGHQKFQAKITFFPEQFSERLPKCPKLSGSIIQIKNPCNNKKER